MDNFSCQLHIIPGRISQLTVLSYEIKHSKKKIQLFSLDFWGFPSVGLSTLFPMKNREISLPSLSHKFIKEMDKSKKLNSHINIQIS